MALPALPGFGFSSTRQYQADAGDIAGQGASFQAFNSGVIDWRAGAAIAGALVLGALILRKRRKL